VTGSRRVLVTGGASGIGAEVVRQFLALGDSVTILDRQESHIACARTVLGDVRSADDNVNAVAVAAPDGCLDVLVANAGIHDGGRKLLDGDINDLAATVRHVLEVNVLGYVLALRAAAGALRSARGAAVLTLSDAAFDVRGNGAGVAYVLAKHSALGLCRSAARDLAPEVRVNAVAPGGVATSLVTESPGGSAPVVADHADLASRLSRRTLLGRGATIEEIASTYVYLASEAAAAMTGQVMRVDGGLIP
jgi:2,3-dihydroxy-2,3-dihydrophenylpropionate dehydrogenase